MMYEPSFEALKACLEEMPAGDEAEGKSMDFF